jgi:hypothetical protein
MKWNLIRTKVLAALAACLVVGVGGILALMYYSFVRNSQALAAESVTGHKGCSQFWKPGRSVK